MAKRSRKQSETKKSSKASNSALTRSAVLGAALFAPAASAATIVVNTTLDNPTAAPVQDGQCTLREAIANANTNTDTTDLDGPTGLPGDCAAGSGADLIQIAIPTGTITLVAGELQVTESATIDGPGRYVVGAPSTGVAVSGNNAFRVFHLGDDIAGAPIQNFTISDLTIKNGNAAGAQGGGIFLQHDNLTLSDVEVTGNQHSSYGGSGVTARYVGDAVAGSGTVTITNSDIVNNLQGGLYLSGFANNVPATLMISGSNLDGNTSGPGLRIRRANTQITGSTFNSNSSGIRGYDANVTLSSGSQVNNNSNRGIRIANPFDAFGSLILESSSVSGNSGTGVDAQNFDVSVTSSSAISTNLRGGLIVEGYRGYAGGPYNPAVPARFAVLTIANSTVDGNLSGQFYGGGIRAKYANTTITGSTVTNNQGPSSNNYSDGGGIFIQGDDALFASLVVQNSAITGNATYGDGGGIGAVYSNVTLDTVNLSNNSAYELRSSYSGNQALRKVITGNGLYYGGRYYAVGDGGGISISGGPSQLAMLTISASTVSGNRAGEDGGGIYGDRANITIDTNTQITGNSAVDRHGGGIAIDGYRSFPSSLTIRNATISANYTASNLSLYGLYGGRGGGIAAENTTVTIQDTLVDGNTSHQGGGGLAVFSENGHSLTLTNVTVSNNMVLYDDGGGGVYLLGPNATINNSFITGNGAVEEGGGVRFNGYYNSTLLGPIDRLTRDPDGGIGYTGSLTISNTVISGNSAAEEGGGIYVDSASGVTLTGVTLSTNTAHGGGGAYISYSQAVLIQNSTITQNQAILYNGVYTSSGGGVQVRSSEVTITTSQITNNSATEEGGGLALYMEYSRIVLDTVTISGNTAATDGGGIFAFAQRTGLYASLSIEHSTISNNQATAGLGGGMRVSGNPMYAGAVDLFMANSTISANTAATGGGLAAEQTSNADLVFVTIAQNTAASSEGGVLVGPTTGGPFNITSSIVGNNNALTNPDMGGTGNIQLAYTLVEVPPPVFADAGGNIFGQDPQLGPLQPNGGPTLTHFPAATSPAIDAADPASTILRDQRGAPRPSGAGFDMGAVEFQGGTVEFSAAGFSAGENAGSVMITVTRTGGTDGPSFVDYSISNGSGTVGSDVAPASGTLMFAANQTSNSFVVTIIQDTAAEGNETINLILSNPQGTTIGTQGTAVLTIVDDDSIAPAETVQFESATYTVDESGGSIAVVVKRTPAGGGAVTVDYTTNNGSAFGGADFTPTSGTLTFGANQTMQTITIPIINDGLDELDENFSVTLSAPTGATLGPQSSTTVTIVDDDVPPAISISDVVELEGTGGNSQFLFAIRLSAPSQQPVTVNFTTVDQTALSGVDYFLNSGTLTFDPGETVKILAIGVVGDSLDENDETFAVTLSNPVGGTLARDTGTGTIRDDDGPAADLAITTSFDRPGSVARFDPLVWIAEVVNNGVDTAEGVRVVIRRPVDNPSDLSTETAYRILRPANCTTNRQDEQIAAGTETRTVTFDVISCEIGTLVRAARARIEILSLADPALLLTADGTNLGQLNHTASVTTSTVDPNQANNTSGWPSVQLGGVAGQTQLLIRDLRDPVAPGGEVTYTVARSGQPLPEGVSIGDLELDPSDNLTVVSLPPGCSTVSGEVSEVLIRCTAFTPFGDFVFRHNNPAALGEIGSLRGDLLVFNTASGMNETVAEGLELTTIGTGALTGDVSVGLSGPTSLNPGVASPFTLTVRNEGPQVANNVTIDISSGEAMIAVIGGGGTLRVVVDGVGTDCTALPCTIGTLAPGETKTIQFTVTPNPGASVIRVVASVTTSAFDPNASNNVVTFTTQLSCASLEAPQIFVVGSVTSEQPYTVSWSAVADADAYILEEATTRDFTTITEARTVTGTSVILVKVVNEPREFYYRVRAVNECGGAAEGLSSVVQTLIEPKPLTLVEPTTSTPFGSVQPVVTTVTVFSPEAGDVPYIAESDQPWVRITPATGVLSPMGTQLQISIDPTGLPVGAQTATIILRRPDLLVTGPNQASGSKTITQVPVSISLVTPVTTASKTAASNDTLIIPVVAHAQGASGEFRSDVRIFNNAVRRVAHRVLFTPSGTDGRQQSLVTNLNIDAGQTVAMDDILRKWFGLGGSIASNATGLIEIRPLDSPSGGSTIATSRTYRIGAPGTGTRGEYIAAVPVSKFLGRTASGSFGGRLNMQQLAQNSQFRTNLGLVEGTGAAASVLVRGFDKAGKVLFSLPVNLKPGEHTQLNSIFAQNNITVNDARIEVTPTGGAGRVTAYASVLDAMTSDALHVAGLNVDEAAANELVVAGVAELQGQTSRWRTDMRIYNTTDRASTATLQFYKQGSTEIASQAAVTIAAGEVVSLDNVVGTTLGQLNTLGAIHVVTNEALIVTARTFNQLAATGATQGQFVPAITPNEGVRVGERSLHMLNVEQSVNFRTNLGLAEMSGSPIRVEVTAIPPDSRAFVRTEVVLGGNEFRQFSNILAQMGLPTVYNARISVRVIDGVGRLTAYASAIDNRTDDAIFVAAK